MKTTNNTVSRKELFDPKENTISVADAAKLWGVCTKTVQRYIHDGRLKAIKIGKRYYINNADFNALFNK